MIMTTKVTNPAKGPLSADLLRKMDAYWRAANYLSVGQIYLYDNPLLKRPLTLAVFGYAMVSCLVVNDALKVAMIKWRVPMAVAWNEGRGA